MGAREREKKKENERVSSWGVRTVAGGAQANPNQLRERLAAVLEPHSSVTLGKSLNLTIISSSVNEGNAFLVGVSSEILVLMQIRQAPTHSSQHTTGPPLKLSKELGGRCTGPRSQGRAGVTWREG